jgi:alanine racemase
MIRETYAYLSEKALESNYHFLRSMLPAGTFFCPMVKCDAYGHGAVEVSKRLQNWGCEQVGVVSVEEAQQLRAAGFHRDILIFGHIDVRGWTAVEEGKFVPVIVSLRELKQLRDSQIQCHFHIKFNTGLNRLGIRLEDLDETISISSTLTKAKLVGLCTHMVQSGDIGQNSLSARQIELFQKAISAFENGLVYHAFNSVGEFRSLEHRKEWLGKMGARPGLALYGVALPEEGDAAQSLQPVMSVYSRVVQVQIVKKGEVVSYDGLWTAPRDSRIGVIPMGYGDGLPWSLKGAWEVLVGDRLVPVVGKICMDHIMVDITEVDKDVYSEEVEIFGARLSVQELSRKAGTIPYEILTGINARVRRVWERPKV